MDIKDLMIKLDHIAKKQNLMESDESRAPSKQKERDVELPSGAKVKARTVQGWQSQRADKDADKDRKDEGIVFRSGIANALLREFGIDEEGSVGGDPSTLTVYGKQGQVDPAKTAAAQTAAGAPAGGQAPSPAASGFKFTPEQEKWLGSANRQDPYILNRMPGAKPPVTYFTDPADQELAKRLKFPAQAATAPTQAPTAAKDDRNEMDKASDLAASQQASQNQAASPAKPAEVPDGINPETGQKYDSVANAPLQLPPGAAPEPGKTVAGGAGGGQGASPAAKGDPKIVAFQQELIKKGAKIKADGVYGPATNQAAMQFGMAPPAGIKTTTNAGGSPPQQKTAPTTGNQSASPKPPPAGLNPEAQKVQAELDRFMKQGYDMNLKANKDHVAMLQSKLAAAQSAGGATNETLVSRIKHLAGI